MDNFIIAVEKLKQINTQLNWRAKLSGATALRKNGFSSPLDHAISLGRLAMVKMLLANDADPNQCSLDNDRQSTERTSLHQAVVSRKLEILDVLLQRGDLDINKRDAEGWSPLNLAIALNDIDIIMKLLDYGANPKEPLVILSKDILATAYRHSIRSVFFRYDFYLTRPRDVEWNSLHLAAHCHEPGILTRMLCEFFDKDDINIQSSLGTTALHEAIVHPRNYDTRNIAVTKNRYKTIEILLKSGAKPGICDNKGRTALHLLFDEINSMKVVFSDSIDMILEACQLVLKYDVDPNNRDEAGRALAHQAAMFGNVDIMKLFLEFGAIGTCKDANGNTPAHLAAYHGNFKLLECMIEWGKFHGKEVNNVGDTVFHAAIKAKKKGDEMREMACLLQKYYDIKIENVFGETAYDLIQKFDLENEINFSDTFGNGATKNEQCMSSEDQLKKREREGECSLEIENSIGEGFTGKEQWKGRQREWGRHLEREKSIGEGFTGRVCKRKEHDSRRKLELKIDEKTDVTDYLVELSEQTKMGEIHIDTEEFCHERCEIAKLTKLFVQELLNLAGQRDERFISKIIGTGSAFEGFRVNKPDEFDYMCEIESLSHGAASHSAASNSAASHSAACEVVDSEAPGFVRIRIKEDHRENWEMFTSQDGLLDSEKIRKYLGEAVEEVSKSIMTVSQSCSLIFSRAGYDTCKFCRPLVVLSKSGLKLTVIWNGAEYPMMPIDIDVTPSIYFKGWPKSANILYPDLLRNCPPDIGYHVIPKSESDDTSLWRLSFSKAELEIFKNVNAMQGVCYTSLKIIRYATSGLSTGEFSHLGSLHTYMLKTKFFEELESTRDRRSWSKNELVNRLCSILESTARYLGQNRTPVVESFFLPGYNVINIKDTVFARIASASMKETLMRVTKLLKKEEFLKPAGEVLKAGFNMNFTLDREGKDNCGFELDLE